MKCLLSYAFSIGLAFSGASASAQSDWTQKASCIGYSRWGAASFVIGEYGYVLAGRDSLGIDHADMYSYHAPTDHWVQKAALPTGKERRLASAWSIGGQGYVLCGEYTSNSRRNDLWQYDPGLNHWNEHASLPSTARYGAYAFTIGGIGYIGAGNGANTPAGPYLTDLWAYDPSTNTWTAHTGIPDQGRFGSVAFTVGDTAYVFGGKQDDLTWTSELWRYVPASDAWTLMAPMPSTGRRYAMAFSTSDHGIVVGGENNNATVPDAWIYTPATNAWAYVPAYPGQGGWAGVNMNFGDTAYAGLGQNNGVPHKDLWSLDLNAITAVHEVPLTSNAFTVCPSLCTAGSIVRFNGKEELLRSIGRIALFDLTGRKVFEAMKGSDNTLRVPELGEGRYVLSVAFADGTSRGLPLTIVD